MAHSRYTREIRKSERAQLARQEKELVELGRQLRRGRSVSVELPLAMTTKQRRRTRLDQTRQRKPAHQTDTPEIRAA